jgi:ribosomal protein S18 acetylase RimI-like enzyme
MSAVEIGPFRADEFEALVAMLRKTLALAELRPEAFARDFLLAPGFEARHLLVARSAPGPIGYVLAPRRDPLAPANRGFIAAFGVDPRLRRQGHGSALLRRAIADMRAEGLAEIDIADVPVRYLVPGVDRVAFPIATDLLTGAFGFTRRDEVASMGLDDAAATRPPGEGLEAPMRVLLPGETALLHDFLAAEFEPDWWAFFARSLRLSYGGDKTPSEIICWWENGRPVGAIHFRGNRFGPLAVGRDARRRGIGAELSLAAIDCMRRLGCRGIHFLSAAADVEPFYAKLGFRVLRRFTRLRLTL